MMMMVMIMIIIIIMIIIKPGLQFNADLLNISFLILHGLSPNYY